MPTFMSLAIETRFQIFGYFLQAPSTIKRIIPEKDVAVHPSPYNKQETTNLFRLVNATAVLFVNRQIQNEAITVFYSLNTIRIDHKDIHSARGLSCDPALLQQAVFDDSSAWTLWSGCACGQSLWWLAKNGFGFPKLKNITINVEGVDCVAGLRRQLHHDPETVDAEDSDDEESNGVDCQIDPEDIDPPPNVQDDNAWSYYHDYLDRLREDRLKAIRDVEEQRLMRETDAFMEETFPDPPDMDLECFGVGRFRIVARDNSTIPDTIFQYHDIVRTWDFYASLPPGHFHLSDDMDDECDHPDLLGDIPCELVAGVHRFFNARAKFRGEAEAGQHFRENSSGLKFGKWKFSRADMQAAEISSEASEYVTTFLLPAATGQKYLSWE
ncbi:hypothetical protein LTR10_013930 [Elasticomyces elasticus]|nr:hypothetical protein LTR10_013930 [Elasticomyces elasticus]KAK4974488.1 hypothetical protein LTR42_005133 [Elasticomyces elasticus]